MSADSKAKANGDKLEGYRLRLQGELKQADIKATVTIAREREDSMVDRNRADNRAAVTIARYVTTAAVYMVLIVATAHVLMNGGA